MSENVISLSARKQESEAARQQTLVDTANELKGIVDAEAVKSLVVLTLNKDDTFDTALAGDLDVLKLVGGLELLKTALLELLYDDE